MYLLKDYFWATLTEGKTVEELLERVRRKCEQWKQKEIKTEQDLEYFWFHIERLIREASTEELLKIEDKLNYKYRDILDYLGADIIIEENVFRIWFNPWKVLDFTSIEELEKILAFNQKQLWN